MTTEHIKGSCEHCGFAYEGDMELREDKYHRTVKCHKCGEATDNFDGAHVVDENDKTEHYNLNYEKVELQYE